MIRFLVYHHDYIPNNNIVETVQITTSILTKIVHSVGMYQPLLKENDVWTSILWPNKNIF